MSYNLKKLELEINKQILLLSEEKKQDQYRIIFKTNKQSFDLKPCTVNFKEFKTIETITEYFQSIDNKEKVKRTYLHVGPLFTIDYYVNTKTIIHFNIQEQVKDKQKVVLIGITTIEDGKAIGTIQKEYYDSNFKIEQYEVTQPIPEPTSSVQTEPAAEPVPQHVEQQPEEVKEPPLAGPFAENANGTGNVILLTSINLDTFKKGDISTTRFFIYKPTQGKEKQEIAQIFSKEAQRNGIMFDKNKELITNITKRYKTAQATGHTISLAFEKDYSAESMQITGNLILEVTKFFEQYEKILEDYND